jgi:hypothetical protein
MTAVLGKSAVAGEDGVDNTTNSGSDIYMCDGSFWRWSGGTNHALCGAVAIDRNDAADSAFRRRIVSDGGIVVHGKAATIADRCSARAMCSRDAL